MNNLPMSGGLMFERWCAWLTGSTAFVLAELLKDYLCLKHIDPKADLTVKVVDVAAVFLAYALTALTVLPAINDREMVKKLRDAGLYRLISIYLAETLFSNALLIILGLGTKVAIDQLECSGRVLPTLSALWWGTAAFALAALIRISRIMIGLVSST